MSAPFKVRPYSRVRERLYQLRRGGGNFQGSGAHCVQAAGPLWQTPRASRCPRVPYAMWRKSPADSGSFGRVAERRCRLFPHWRLVACAEDAPFRSAGTPAPAKSVLCTSLCTDGAVGIPEGLRGEQRGQASSERPARALLAVRKCPQGKQLTLKTPEKVHATLYMESVPDGILIFDEGGRIELLNPSPSC